MIAISLILMLAGAAVYIEFMTPWIVENSGRPERAFFSNRFVADTDLGWRGISNYTAYVKKSNKGEPSIFYATNEHGFRALDKERSFPDSGTVMVLGDSFVQGVYLAQNETIAHHLSKRLNGYAYNFGVAGYSTDQEYTLFKKWIDRIRAEWVVLVFYANDLLYLDIQKAQKSGKPKYEIKNGLVNFEKLERLPALTANDWGDQATEGLETHDVFCCLTKRQDRIIGRIQSRFTSYIVAVPYPSALLSKLRHDIRFTKLNVNAQNLEVQDEFFSSPTVFKDKLKLAFQFFKDMKKHSELRGSKFLLVYMPDVRQVVNGDGKDRSLLTKSFVAMCGEHKIECIDPTNKIAQKQKVESMYFLDDGHMSPAGTSQLSEIIAKRIGGSN